MSDKKRRKPTIDDQIEYLRRQADWQSNALPNRVAAGKMTQNQADFILDTIEAAISTLKLVRKYARPFADMIRCDRAERQATADAGRAQP